MISSIGHVALQVPNLEASVAWATTVMGLREVERLRLEQVAAIERVAALTRDEARTLLLQRVEEEVRTEAGRRARLIEMDARAQAETQARKILSVAIQRYSSDTVGEITTTVVPIPNDSTPLASSAMFSTLARPGTNGRIASSLTIRMAASLRRPSTSTTAMRAPR